MSIILKLILICLAVQWMYEVNSCQDVTLDGYKFSLSSLADKDDEEALRGKIYPSSNNSMVSISFCSPIKCNDICQPIKCDNDTKVGFVYLDNEQCTLFTSNKSGLIQSSYEFIDPKNPTLGIAFNFVPIYQLSSNKLFSTRIKLYCHPKNIKLLNCTNDQIPIKITDTETILNNLLVCSINASQGCPILAVNDFWQFLIEHTVIFAIVFWICALFLILLGYLVIRITILLYGIFIGCLFGVIFTAENYVNFYQSSNWIFIYIICISVVMGLLFGIFLLTVPKIGYINIGVFVAALLSLVLQNSVLFLSGSLLAFYITFGVTALVMSIIALMQFRYFIICCSSFTGAFLLIRPLGFLLPGYPNEMIHDRNFEISGERTPWQFYLYLGSMIVLTIMGIVTQRWINRKMFRRKKNQGGFYLEGEGSLREKLAKVFEFKEIKKMIREGKKELLQLKCMITDDHDNPELMKRESDDSYFSEGNYIEMKKIQEIQQKARKAGKQPKRQQQQPKPKQPTRDKSHPKPKPPSTRNIRRQPSNEQSPDEDDKSNEVQLQKEAGRYGEKKIKKGREKEQSEQF